MRFADEAARELQRLGRQVVRHLGISSDWRWRDRDECFELPNPSRSRFVSSCGSIAAWQTRVPYGEQSLGVVSSRTTKQSALTPVPSFGCEVIACLLPCGQAGGWTIERPRRSDRPVAQQFDDEKHRDEGSPPAAIAA